jgi:hypothetical protein
MKPTPGPWRAECVGSEGGENPLDVYEVNNGRARIAEYVSEADARLISASPELLNALLESRHYWTAATPVAVRNLVRSAIAKATGESA